MSGKAINITEANFETEVIKSDKPVLVDFWASWCGPCMMISPIISELADGFDGKIKVAKINVDEQVNLASQYKIMTIPTVLIFKNGQITDKSIGANTKDYFVDMINKAI